jgi:uncharacterized protein YbjT (DUF2867 family)
LQGLLYLNGSFYGFTIIFNRSSFKMLILIAGITGNMGKHLAQSALDRGHQVRGLGRSPKNLPSKLRDELENFIVSSSYYDISAIEQAVHGVDAVVCAYAGLPELQLDAQLILLRAAERAGLKVGIQFAF